jgi:hypothetical protein
MSSLILPASAVDARRLAALEHADAAMRYWDPLLREIDEHLSLRRAFARTQWGVPGIFPGLWHIVRRVPGGALTAWAISTNGLGEPGDYREMGHDILETLRRGDMWDKTRVYEAEMRARRREASEERAHENHREARREDLAVNVKAMVSPGVSRAARGARAKSRKK